MEILHGQNVPAMNFFCAFLIENPRWPSPGVKVLTKEPQWVKYFDIIVL